ncbi:hypothetical protein NA78x_001755 [Anatilimnocola sp. NA78]|uniref:hypothetical protein n=1 Tax=Anatilimnocola sp. NA78 TaxID=3415683 RepID=UPI003CE54C1F
MGTKIIPAGMKFWPESPDAVFGYANSPDFTSAQVQQLYEQGYAGAYEDQDERAAFRATMKWAKGEDAARAFGLEGTGADLLILPFLSAMKIWPGCWPGPGQTTGDCVSWGTKNACLVTLGVEIDLAKPDEVTGKVEGAFDISPEGISQGVLSTEVIYGYRGHGGQGADCSRLARYVTTAGGLMIRQNYPDLNLDLTKYNSSIGARWGGRDTPAEVNAVAKLHQVRTSTELSGHEQVRDFLANGYGVNNCSSLGFSSTRNEDGFSEQRGSWAHSQSMIGADYRPDTINKYGCPLHLWLNSWGKWNSGPRRIWGTNIDIPEGAYWAKATLASRCYLVAFSSVNGWPRKKLPNYGFSYFG